jgi:hypothetical protein
MYGQQFITNISAALQVNVANLQDPHGAKQELHQCSVEELSRDLAAVDQLKASAREKAETTTLGEIEKTIKNARQRGLECLQRALKLAKDRVTLLAEFEAAHAKKLRAAEDFHASEWSTVQSGLAAVGVTVETHAAFAVNPDGARNIVHKQIRDTARVRDAQSKVDQASNDLNMVRTLQENAAAVVAGCEKELNDFIAGIVG